VGCGELFLMQLSDTHPSDGLYQLIYPFVVGFLLGIFGRSPVWIVGPAIMLFWPIGLVIDLFKGGGGLNLWPFSLVFCGVFASIGLAGAAAGRWAKQRWSCQKQE
jgi:MFS superfamily sulfate permease-like transporter